MTLETDVERDIDRLLEEGSTYDQIIDDLIDSANMSEHDSLKLRVAIDGVCREYKPQDVEAIEIESRIAALIVSHSKEAIVSVDKAEKEDAIMYFEGDKASPVAFWFRFADIDRIVKSKINNANRRSIVQLFYKCGIVSRNLPKEWSAKRLRMHRVHKTAIQALEEIAKGAS